MERNEAIAVTNASHRLSFVATAGEMFRRIHWNNHGCKSIVWRCISKLEPIGLECHAKTINELDLQEIVLTALNELLGDKSKYQKQLQQNIASVIRASAAITTDGIDEKLMDFYRGLLKRPTTKKPRMKLPTRFLHSEKSASKPQWTWYSVMNSYSVLQNCRILSKTSLPTLQYLMNHL